MAPRKTEAKPEKNVCRDDPGQAAAPTVIADTAEAASRPENDDLRAYLAAFTDYLPQSKAEKEEALRDLVWRLFDLSVTDGKQLYKSAWEEAEEGSDRYLKYSGFRAQIRRLKRSLTEFNSSGAYDGPKFALCDRKIAFARVREDSIPAISIMQRLRAHNQRLASAACSEAATTTGLYVPRRNVEKELSQFLKSDKRLFVLVGKSGSGKSTTVSHFAIHNQEATILFLGDLNRTANLEFPSAIDRVLSEIGNEASSPHSEISITGSLGVDTCLVVVDALESTLDPAATLESITRWLCSPSAFGANAKILLTCGPEAWAYLTQQREVAIPLDLLFAPTALKAKEHVREDHSAELDDYTDSELKVALRSYEKHCALKKGTLSKRREALRNPYLLRLAADLMSGESTVLRRDSDNDILQAFWNRRILRGPKTLEGVALGFAERLLEKRRESAPERSISNETWYDEATVRRLIDDGVLARVGYGSDRHLCFSHSRLLVQALANVFSSSEDGLSKRLDDCLESVSFYAPLPLAIAESLRDLPRRERRSAFEQVVARASSPEGSFLMGCVFAQLAPLSCDDLQAFRGLGTTLGIESVSALIKGVAHVAPDQSLRMLSDIVGAIELTTGMAADLSMSFAGFPQTAFTPTFRATLCEWRDGDDETLRAVATYPVLDRLFSVGMVAEAFAAMDEFVQDSNAGVRAAAAAHLFSALWTDRPKALSLVERFAADEDPGVVDVAAKFVALFLDESPGNLDDFLSWASPTRKPLHRFLSGVTGRLLRRQAGPLWETAQELATASESASRAVLFRTLAQSAADDRDRVTSLPSQVLDLLGASLQGMYAKDIDALAATPEMLNIAGVHTRCLAWKRGKDTKRKRFANVFLKARMNAVTRGEDTDG